MRVIGKNAITGYFGLLVYERLSGLAYFYHRQHDLLNDVRFTRRDGGFRFLKLISFSYIFAVLVIFNFVYCTPVEGGLLYPPLC